MNELAKELNEKLAKSPVFDMLSDFGKRIYVPNGIVVQSQEAKKKATKYNATIGTALSHKKPINMPLIRDQFSDSLAEGEIFTYAPMGGILDLRKAWKEEMVAKNPSLKDKNISLPVVCAGLTHGLSTIASIFIDKGDTIVSPSLYWENYNLIFSEQRQAEMVFFDNFDGNGFNLKGLDNAISGVRSDKIVIVLNFPNNPTGYTPTETESSEIVKIVVKYAQAGKKIVCISDDAYYGLFFEKDVAKESLFAKLCNAHENILAVKCDGATKEDMVWGFRVGFITYGSKGLDQAGLDSLVQKTLGTVRGSISCCNTSAQNILLKAMQSPDFSKQKHVAVEILSGRYDVLKKTIEKHKDDKLVTPYPFNSGYFMSFDTKVNAQSLKDLLLEKYAIGTICINEHVLRIAFSSVDEENIEDLVDTIYKAATEI